MICARSYGGSAADTSTLVQFVRFRNLLDGQLDSVSVGRGYVRQRVASTYGRILLHLLCVSETGKPELHRLTQEGIAHDIRAGRSTVAKALLRLDAARLIEGRREHVPAHRLRKHVYRLADAGWGESFRERARLERVVVRVYGLGTKELRVRAGELPELFPSAGGLSGLVARIKNGALSADDLEPKDEEPCLPVAWGADRPLPKPLVGREDGARQLDGWLASQSKTLTVTGLAGIGKTALVADAVARWRPRRAVCWVVVRQWSSPEALTADLAKFLSATGRRGLERALADRMQPGAATVAELLRHEFRGLRAVLVFDDVHEARQAVRRWFDFLALTLQPTPCRLVLVGRAAPRLGARGVHDLPRPELRVGPLDSRAAVELLRLKGWDPNDPIAARIAREARGNPLLLLLGAKAGPAAGREISRFLEDEVWSRLSIGERRTLEAACCLRRSAPMRALLAMPGVDPEALRRLERQNLIDQTESGTFAVHSSIEDFVHERIPSQRAKAYHTAALRYFLSVPEPAARLEAIHHALAAGKPDEAAELLRRHGEPLFNSVSFAALQDVLEPIEPASLPPGPGAALAEAKGDALRRTGSVRPAQARYEQALRLADPTRQPGDRARVLRKLAEFDRLAGRLGHAKDRLQEAARLIDRVADPREASNVYRECALLGMARGALGEAEDHLKRALQSARKARDPARFSRALLVFGTLEAARGRPVAGLQRKLRALHHAEASGELLEVARDAISVGVSHAEMKRFAEALPYYDHGLEMARLLGDVRLTSVSQLNRGAALLDLGRWSEARDALGEADRLSALVGEKVARGFIAIGAGQLEMGLGRWRRAVDAFEKGLETLRSCAGPFDLARGLIDVARFYSSHGDSAMAAERLEEALDSARSLHNDELASEIDRELSLHQVTAPAAPASVVDDSASNAVRAAANP